MFLTLGLGLVWCECTIMMGLYSPTPRSIEIPISKKVSLHDWKRHTARSVAFPGWGGGNAPLSCLGGYPLSRRTVSGGTPPPPCERTHTHEKITSRRTTYAGVKMGCIEMCRSVHTAQNRHNADSRWVLHPFYRFWSLVLCRSVSV